MDQKSGLCIVSCCARFSVQFSPPILPDVQSNSVPYSVPHSVPISVHMFGPHFVNLVFRGPYIISTDSAIITIRTSSRSFVVVVVAILLLVILVCIVCIHVYIYIYIHIYIYILSCQELALFCRPRQRHVPHGRQDRQRKS